jgi:FMN reductase
MKIVLIAGSPSAPSRVATLIEHVAARLAEHHAGTEVFGLDAFEPASLVYANTRAPAVARYIQAVAAADALVVATPVYQSSFSGALKLLLDLIPQNGLRDKSVLPIAAGGSAHHLLTLDYALKPVLASLGADRVLGGVYASGPDLVRDADRYRIQPGIRERLDAAADELASRLRPSTAQPLALRRVEPGRGRTVFATAAGEWLRKAAG